MTSGFCERSIFLVAALGALGCSGGAASQPADAGLGGAGSGSAGNGGASSIGAAGASGHGGGGAGGHASGGTGGGSPSGGANGTRCVSFVEGTPLAVGDIPDRIDAADFDNDGKLDLAVTNQGGTTMNVFLGNGDGTFQPSRDVTYQQNGIDAVGEALGDVNGDGHLDIVVADKELNGTVLVFLGNGDGTFTKGTNVTFGLSDVNSVSLADLDGDGRLDIVAGLNLSLSVRLGKGDGTFGAETDFLALHSDNSAVVADLNKDGKLDAIALSSNLNNSGVDLLFGDGKGGFGLAQPLATDEASSVAATDLNGDGKIDLLVLGLSKVTSYINDGTGVFTAIDAVYVDDVFFSVVTGDLNGDGVIDAVVPGVQYNEIAVLYGKGDGTFFAPEYVDPHEANADDNARPSSMVIGDFNRDGRLDIAAATPSTKDVTIFINGGLAPTCP